MASLALDGQTLVDVQRRMFVPAWRRHVALVFQDGQLFPHMTVRGNLLYGYERRAPDQRRLQLQQVLDLLELGPLVAVARRSCPAANGSASRSVVRCCARRA